MTEARQARGRCAALEQQPRREKMPSGDGSIAEFACEVPPEASGRQFKIVPAILHEILQHNRGRFARLHRVLARLTGMTIADFEHHVRTAEYHGEPIAQPIAIQTPENEKFAKFWELQKHLRR